MAKTDNRQGVVLGQWVKQRRETLGMTQADVWRRMEIAGDANWLSLLESGQRRTLPDTDYLVALSQALRVTMTDVLRGAGVLPVDIEESPEEALGSHTIHALVDMIDWVSGPQYREATEAFLRGILDQQRASSVRSSAVGRDQQSR